VWGGAPHTRTRPHTAAPTHVFEIPRPVLLFQPITITTTINTSISLFLSLTGDHHLFFLLGLFLSEEGTLFFMKECYGGVRKKWG
jgi:hypothetical protein